MIVSVPAHELVEYETQTIRDYLKQTEEASAEFEKYGGVFANAGKGKRWVGIDSEPQR